MDKYKAKEWGSRLKGKEIAGWKINSFIDHGKSAAVFNATQGEKRAALKIFDDEIIERFGDKAQLARIDRELSLIGKSHENMVEILDGGVDKESNNHFIVMEFIDGPNLQSCLNKIPEENIPRLIEQLASCCEYLETLSLVHRDIKPANIVITDSFKKLVLLDFGVMKPVGEVGVTDINGIQSFIGTLQYSSPEFLLRKEEDTIEGWRALSLYQIGGVLHDLLMRKPLFNEYINPYARLVNAVQHDVPPIANSNVPSYLVDTCRAALVKDPTTRLDLVGWHSFRPPLTKTVGAAARERVTKRSLLGNALTGTSSPTSSNTPDLINAAINILKIEARRIRNTNTSAFPPLIVVRVPSNGNSITIRFRSEVQQELPTGLSLEVRVEVIDEVAQAIAVNVSAWLGEQNSRPENCSDISVYKGVFDTVALVEVLEETMYLALDIGQSRSPAECGLLIDLSTLKVVS